MKTLLVLLALGLVGFMAYKKFTAAPFTPGAPMEHPVYGEMRVNTVIENREIEMALFVRVPDKGECLVRARKQWAELLDACPGCQLQPIECQDTLSPRYARLFDDVPIPSTYLSLAPGEVGEREGRLVVYGLTDQEGVLVCEQMRTVILTKYHGTAHCVPPSGD